MTVSSSACANRSSVRSTTIPKSALEATPEEREREFDRMWDAGGFAFWLANYQDMFFTRKPTSCADYIKRKIRKTVKDPVVAEKLIPKGHDYGTKRQPLDTNYYETFNKDNVLLVDAATDGASKRSPRKAFEQASRIRVRHHRVRHRFDAMTGPLKALEPERPRRPDPGQGVVNGPRSYWASRSAGFPNLFTITGPQSPSVLSNMPVSIEQHVEWVTDCIDTMRKTGKASASKHPPAQDQWVAHVNEIVNTTLMTSANSWYMSANIPANRVPSCPIWAQPRCRWLPEEVRRGRGQGLRGIHAGIAPRSRPEGGRG